MKKQFLLLILVLAITILPMPAEAGFSVDTYFAEDNQAKQHVEVEKGEEAIYFIDVLPNSWAESLEVETKIYDDTNQLLELETIFEDDHQGNDPYYSPQLTVEQEDYKYPGEYFLDIKVTQENSDGSETIVSEQIYLTVEGERILEADFSFTPEEPKVDEEVTFTSETIAEGTSLESETWFVEGQQIATGEGFTHSFSEPGEYDVTLKAEASRGLEDEKTKTIVVSEEEPEGPTADFTFTPEEPIQGEEVTFTSTSEPGDTAIDRYEWRVDGLDVSDQEEFTYQVSESIEVQLRIMDENGLEDVKTKQVSVQPAEGPIADFEFDPLNPEEGEEVTFTSTSEAGDWPIESYVWMISGSSVSTEDEFEQVFNESGSYEVKLEVEDSAGNTDVRVKNVEVSELVGPTADFEYEPENPVVGERITFTSTSEPGDADIETFVWSVSDEEFADGEIAERAFDAGTYEISLFVQDENGKTDSESKTITVEEEELEGPTAGFEYTPEEPEVGEEVTFTSMSEAGDNPISSYEWEIEGEYVSSQDEFSHIFDSPGVYTVRLEVEDTAGLVDSTSQNVEVVTPPSEGPEADFTFSPAEPMLKDTVTFETTSQPGTSPIETYKWELHRDGNLVEQAESQENIVVDIEETGLYEMTHTVVDEEGLQDFETKGFNVELSELTITELGANSNVVIGKEQHISTHVAENGANSENAEVEFYYLDNDEKLGSCDTNEDGYCSINPVIDREPGIYQIYAFAYKDGLKDESKELVTEFEVWEERYEVINLKLFEDEFQTESYEYYRGESIYSAFDVRDKFTGQMLDPSQDIIDEVFLRVHNEEEEYFDKYTGTAIAGGEFKHNLDKIPLTNDFLGEGKVFSMVFNFSDRTAGQEQVDLTIRNNPVEFNPPSEFRFDPGELKAIDFRDYLDDVETPVEDIELSFENLGPFTEADEDRNVYTFEAPMENIVQTVTITADDTDGSQETREVDFIVDSKGPTADFVFDPEEPVVDEFVTFTSTSEAGDNPIGHYRWIVEGTVQESQDEIQRSFGEPRDYDMTLVVEDSAGLKDNITKTITVSEEEVEGPTARLDVKTTVYVGEETRFDAGRSEGDIETYIFEVNGDIYSTSDDFLDYTFEEEGVFDVTLTVEDIQGNTDTTTESVTVRERRPDIVVGDYDNLHVGSLMVYGTDNYELSLQEPYEVRAKVTNNRDETIENLRMSFTIRELGFRDRGSTFTLEPGESRTVRVHGYLPFSEEELWQDEYIATVDVHGSGFSRNKYQPIEILS